MPPGTLTHHRVYVLSSCPSHLIVSVDFVIVFDVSLESKGGFVIDMNGIKQHEI